MTLWEDGHHGDDFAHLWCAAPPGTQDELVGICEEAYRVVAPKRLVAVLDARRVSAERSRRAAPPPRAAVAFALSVSVLVLCPV